MKQIKMPSQLKELLEAHRVPSTSIELVESHYSDVINEVVKEVSEESKEATKPVDEEKDFRNKARQVAEESRIVK